MEKPQSLVPTLSVSDFLASVNQTLDYAYPNIQVEGEVASFKVNQGKYVFFDIKDSGGSVSCFMTVWQLRLPIQDGMKVIVKAAAKVTQWGKFSLTVQSVRPSGEGNLHKSYELLKQKLEQEGLFDPGRKRPLPYLPGHIAVISSTQAAGYVDFITILNERWGGMQVDVAHVQVQGESAPDQIIRAIRYFNEQSVLPEVVVIVRGGGSADDLACFNDELLVREIAASRIPTLVGVGHEIDETLADFAADMRAATPSNAAQIVVPDKHETLAAVGYSVQAIGRVLTNHLQNKSRNVMDVMQIMRQAIDQQLALKQNLLDRTLGLLAVYNPAAVMAHGYAIVRGRVSVGQSILVTTSKKEITAEVTNVKNR